MPRFAANLSMLFTELPFLDRFAAARAVGFAAVEFQFPYAHAVAELSSRVKDNGLEVVLFNLPPGEFEIGERGIACLPGREAEFASGVEVALRYANELNCPKINCLAGFKPAGLDRGEALAVLLSNLSYAAGKLSDHAIQLIVEPLNTFDMPGFLLNRSADALAVMDALGPANVKLQYDLYHMQRMEGELMATLSRLLPRIGHIQLADVPGRHEPGTGEINYRNVFSHIDTIGYDGWVGCEYKPLTTTQDGLGWLAAHGITL